MYALARPLLFRLDAEKAHELVFASVAGLGPVARLGMRLTLPMPDPRLAVTVAGLRWPTPVGLAAGLDKDGRLVRFWPELGFGAVELGTVTALAQPGNPRPRLFRVPDAGALINRMGFNNAGSQALATRLRALRDAGAWPEVPIGVNLGKSKVTELDDAVQDYATSAQRLAELADYLVVNVSSPNTPGLRTLQDADRLAAIVRAVVGAASGRPVFVKLAPDLGEPALDDAVAVSAAEGAAGFIATNTTIDHQGLAEVGAGGLSGRPLFSRALEVVRHVAARTDLPVIGVGGVHGADQVLEMLAAGAAAVQIYTALIYEGPTLVGRILGELSRALDESGAPDLPTLVASSR
ncbi:MAG: quinone-dependent dihydroorotate dehydrogenase [Deltaproteobacteria bacterium]|nr:quinone-dependent dihydroorotate dehydrogenase [Deltaproteobacteria bacterium]